MKSIRTLRTLYQFMSFGIMNNLLNECLGYMKIHFQKKKLYFGHSHRKMFFFLEILISPLPSSNKCILVLNYFFLQYQYRQRTPLSPPYQRNKEIRTKY